MRSAGHGSIDVETVADNLMEPVFAIDVDGDVAFANDRFLEISGLSREAVIGSSFDVFARIVEEGFDEFRAAVDAVAGGASDEERVELGMLHPEAAPVPRRLPAESRITPIDDDGTHLGVLVSMRNISTRKAHEERLARQNERLEEFAGVVSHDLRNPLNVADARLHLAEEDCDCEHLAPIREALDRMAAIIDGTLALARQGRHVGELEEVSLADVAERCWSVVETGGAGLVVEDDPTISADPDRLANLLENLFRNSVEHGTADGRPVTVRVGAIDGEGFFVADDGPGIPRSDRDHVFQLGASSGEGGTGFGLAIVRWIAEAHGWVVTVTESADGGARFEITDVDGG